MISQIDGAVGLQINTCVRTLMAPQQLAYMYVCSDLCMDVSAVYKPQKFTTNFTSV